ncbi:MAG: radical SAM protein [Chloroflexi bacterium]|nr:radical SAM protein [Chloroflexota bacterium]
MTRPTRPAEFYDFYPLEAMPWPVFRCDHGAHSLFYAPGCLCAVRAADADGFLQSIGPDQGPGWGRTLWEHAQQAIMEYEALQYSAFAPECLTVYLHNDCNLACTYCFSDPMGKSSTRISLSALRSAAEQVAANCHDKGMPFYVVFHGGGEPTLYWSDVDAALTVIAEIADRRGVETFRYIATNGCLSTQKARWLAHHFDLVGLSCDGPPDIHNHQRPHANGGQTAKLVERTAAILHQESQPFHVRATITPETITCQPEIAAYIAMQLAPQAISFEPVYTGGRASGAQIPDRQQAALFVAYFLQARDVAAALGIPLDCSGSRMATIHGPYCNIFRQVLNLVPGGLATACFKATEVEQVRATGVAIGESLPGGAFYFDTGAIQGLQQRLAAFAPECLSCFNRYHCTRGCPDQCPLDAPGAFGTFRCEVQRQLSLAAIDKRARELIADITADRDRGANVYGTCIF